MTYYDQLEQREIKTFNAWIKYVAEPKKEYCPDCGREMMIAPVKKECTGGFDGCFYKNGE